MTEVPQPHESALQERRQCESSRYESAGNESARDESAGQDGSLRSRLRALDAFPTVPSDFDADLAPENPYELLATWLEEAIAGDVSQPHAMVLSTVDRDGCPDARTVLLKDVTADRADPDSGAGRGDGFWFASMSDGPKAEQLAQNPAASLTFYWREQARQIRVRGRVLEGSREVSEADFLARGPGARAAAITGEQSRRLPGADAVRRQLAAAQEFLAGNPLFVPATWAAYRLQPEQVEFWQTVTSREQVRVRYSRVGSGWEHAALWS